MLDNAVSEKDRQILRETYEFADLSAYSREKRFLIRAADVVFYLLIWLIGKTIRFEARGLEHLEEIKNAGKLPIQCFWHDQIFLATYFFRHRRIVVMASQSFDGEYIARFIQRFGYGSVRGSSTRGGIGALVKQIRLMKLGCPAGFAIDGPRGPRHVVKEGALLLAKKTQNPILPFSVTPRSYWTIKSWDKMQIPRPFTRALVEIAPPILLAADAIDNDIAAKSRDLQNELDKLTLMGERWRIDSKHNSK